MAPKNSGTKISKPLGVRTKRRTQSAKSGLTFPVARFAKKLKTMPQAAKRVSKPAGVYVTAVIEYLMGFYKNFTIQL